MRTCQAHWNDFAFRYSVVTTNKAEISSPIVLVLSVKCFCRKLAEQYLDEAYHTVGSIDDLDEVYKKAVKSATYATQSFSSSSLLAELPSSSSKTKLQTSSSTTNSAATSMPRMAGSAVVSQPSSKAGFSYYKTALCNNWKATRNCPHGDYCMFAHGKGELRTVTVSEIQKLSTSIICMNWSIERVTLQCIALS